MADKRKILYLIDGRMRLYRPILELKAESGESRLDRVIARIARETAGEAPDSARAAS